MKNVKLFEEFVSEASAKRPLVTYGEIRNIVDLVNNVVAAKNSGVNGIFAYTLSSIFGDHMDKAERGAVKITVHPKTAGAVLDLLDWAEENNYSIGYNTSAEDMRKKFAYGEETRGEGIS
jgi:hypothetical protein